MATQGREERREMKREKEREGRLREVTPLAVIQKYKKQNNLLSTSFTITKNLGGSQMKVNLMGI